MTNIEERLQNIELRNRQKELEKAWETSWSRRILIAMMTYFVVGLYLNWLKVSDPWLNAIVPVVGFVLSTMALPFFKELWIKHRLKK